MSEGIVVTLRGERIIVTLWEAEEILHRSHYTLRTWAHEGIVKPVFRDPNIHGSPSYYDLEELRAVSETRQKRKKSRANGYVEVVDQEVLARLDATLDAVSRGETWPAKSNEPGPDEYISAGYCPSCHNACAYTRDNK